MSVGSGGVWRFTEETADGSPRRLLVRVIGRCASQTQVETNASGLAQNLEGFAAGGSPSCCCGRKSIFPWALVF